MNEPITITTLSIEGLDCPAEEKLIRQQLLRISEIEKMDFNFLTQEVTIHHHLPQNDVLQKNIESLGMSVTIKENASTRPQNRKDNQSSWWLIGFGGALALTAELVAIIVSTEQSLWVLGLSLAAMISSGLPTFKKGWLALRTKTMNINSLMMIAIIGAILIGEWPEAAMVTVLFALAERIERYSLDKARLAIQKLMEFAPDEATVQIEDGNWQKISVSQVTIGAIVWVKPGERIPLDGEIISGKSSINQAPITGESMPMTKQPGDLVYAGTLNERGSFQFKVTEASGDTLLARIGKTVEQAQAQSAPTQRFVDQFAKYYTPFMVLFALGVAIVPPLVWSVPFYLWVYKALTLLVIACPCALVISTPVTVVSGLAAAAKHGLLIKGGTYLENGRHLKMIALDKTGTLTEGKPVVTDFIAFDEQQEDYFLQLAASIDSHSEHPVAQALITYWQEKQPGKSLLPIVVFEALPGRGVMGTINGEPHYVGNHQLAEDNQICNPDIEKQLKTLEEQGKTTVILSNTKQVLAIFAVADTVRETSQLAVSALHQRGIKTCILTGDNPITANAIAKLVGIDEVQANVLPEEKLRAIDDLIARYHSVGMVGDGINDAPALAKATVGFAMGKGTDTALETADVALMNNNLLKLPFFIDLSRKTMQVLRQNIGLSIAIKIIFFALALAGIATLWMAVFADMGASLIVVANGLRLLTFQDVTQSK